MEPTAKRFKGEDKTHEIVESFQNEKLNTDCLAKIIKYLPVSERLKFASVCQHWQRGIIDVSWINVDKLEFIYWRYDEYQNRLANFSTSDGGYNFLISLLHKCGCHLTILDLTGYGHCNIVPVINDYCPNLVTLRLRFTSIDNALLDNAFTRLSKLKSLTIIFQNMEDKLIPMNLLNSLRNVSDTLTNLSLLNWIDNINTAPDFSENIFNVIAKLKALETLELAGLIINSNAAMELERQLIEYFNYTTYLRTVQKIHYLQAVPKIEFGHDYLLTDDSLYSIANSMPLLTVLSFYSDSVTDQGMQAIAKMNKLRALDFNGDTEITDSSVKLLRGFIKIGFPSSTKISEQMLLKVLENSPEMTWFSVYGIPHSGEFIIRVEELVKAREQKLTLVVENIIDSSQYDSEFLTLHVYNQYF